MKNLLNKFFDYVSSKNLKDKDLQKIEPGETELDYVDLKEIKLNKRALKMNAKKETKVTKK